MEEGRSDVTGLGNEMTEEDFEFDDDNTLSNTSIRPKFFSKNKSPHASVFSGDCQCPSHDPGMTWSRGKEHDCRFAASSSWR